MDTIKRRLEIWRFEASVIGTRSSLANAAADECELEIMSSKISPLPSSPVNHTAKE